MAFFSTKLVLSIKIQNYIYKHLPNIYSYIIYLSLAFLFSLRKIKYFGVLPYSVKKRERKFLRRHRRGEQYRTKIVSSPITSMSLQRITKSSSRPKRPNSRSLPYTIIEESWAFSVSNSISPTHPRREPSRVLITSFRLISVSLQIKAITPIFLVSMGYVYGGIAFFLPVWYNNFIKSTGIPV